MCEPYTSQRCVFLNWVSERSVNMAYWARTFALAALVATQSPHWPGSPLSLTATGLAGASRPPPPSPPQSRTLTSATAAAVAAAAAPRACTAAKPCVVNIGFMFKLTRNIHKPALRSFLMAVMDLNRGCVQLNTTMRTASGTSAPVFDHRRYRFVAHLGETCGESYNGVETLGRMYTSTGWSKGGGGGGGAQASSRPAGANIGGGIVGFVGPSRSVVSQNVAMAARIRRLVVVSYGSTSTLLADNSNYPNFLRTVPNDDTQAMANARVVQYE